MNTNSYLRNLSKTYSGNYLAMIGFVIFAFSTIGVVSRLIQGIVFKNISIIKGIPFCFLGEIYCYLPITCILALLPLGVLFKSLIAPKQTIKKQCIHILLSVFLCTAINIFAPDYTIQGQSIIFVIVPIYGFVIPLIALLIYAILFCFDLVKKINIKNSEFINNKLYQKFVEVFFRYSIFIIISTLLIIIIFTVIDYFSS